MDYTLEHLHYFPPESPKRARWVGGVRCLGQSPKKNGYFFDTFPNGDTLGLEQPSVQIIRWRGSLVKVWEPIVIF